MKRRDAVSNKKTGAPLGRSSEQLLCSAPGLTS
jgi:hypothetical protein